MNQRIRLAVFIVASAILVVFFTQYMGEEPSLKREGVLVAGGKPLPDFILVDQKNSNFSLDSVRGRPIILFFGYTNCPDICPLAMRKISDSLNSLGSAKGHFAVIFITVDPLRDTPERLADWTARYYPDAIALTGDIEELKRVWTSYGVARSEDYETSSGGGGFYYVSHSAVIYIADKNHVLRYILTPEMSPEDFKQSLMRVMDS